MGKLIGRFQKDTSAFGQRFQLTTQHIFVQLAINQNASFHFQVSMNIMPFGNKGKLQPFQKTASIFALLSAISKSRSLD